jgi:hypothetical protein
MKNAHKKYVAEIGQGHQRNKNRNFEFHDGELNGQI